MHNSNDLLDSLPFNVNASMFKSGAQYLESLWSNGPSRLLFIRIDLGIGIQHQAGLHAFQIIEYFARLNTNRRNKPKIFRHYIGIVWRLEWTPDKSYHYHCLFIFDGSAVQDGVYYANAIGYYWHNDITNGTGTFWNCNNEADNYPESGIGMIDHRDAQKRDFLLTRVLAYLAKPDLQIRQAIDQDAMALGRPDLASHVRTFSTSNALPPRESKVGRPRTNVPLSSTSLC